jgi:NADH-quinone oxidoreductase subunit M
MGFIVLGVFALSNEAAVGAVLQMVNHGIVTAGLFLLVLFLAKRTGSIDVTRLSGLQRTAPVLAGFFTVVMLASIGVAGLNGFIGEFLILTGTFITHRWYAVVATTGVVVAAAYFLWVYQQAFHGAPVEASDARPVDRPKIADLGWAEKAAIAPVIVAIVFLGVYPKPVLDRINPAVRQLVTHVETAGNTPAPLIGPRPNGPAGPISATGATK